jgi:hypothetical protein
VYVSGDVLRDSQATPFRCEGDVGKDRVARHLWASSPNFRILANQATTNRLRRSPQGGDLVTPTHTTTQQQNDLLRGRVKNRSVAINRYYQNILTPQSPASEFPSVPTNQELLNRLEATEAELRYLRERDQEHSGGSTSARHDGVAQAVGSQDVVDPASPFQSLGAPSVVQCGSTSCDQCPCGACQGMYRPTCQGTGPLCKLCKETLSWNKGDWRIVPFGRLRGEAIYASAATSGDAVIAFLNPKNPGISEDMATIHGKQSQLNFQLTGPTYGDWKTGGIVMMNYMGAQPLRNFSGANIVLAYGEVKNDQWRFAFGRMLDLFAPINPTTVNQLQQRGAGNVGIYQGAMHLDRYITVSERAKWTLSGRISQQDNTDYAAVPLINGKDNGWPNIEARIGLELGKMADFGRPIEVGISGVVGEIQAVAGTTLSNGTVLTALDKVEPTRGVAVDLQLQGERLGFHSEVWYGRGAGTYFVAALQSLNPETSQSIESVGGWADISYKCNSCLTTHLGYGVDDPKNSQLGFIDRANLGIGQISFNQVAWWNAIWNVTDAWELSFETSYRRTKFLAPDARNDGFIIHTASTLYF